MVISSMEGTKRSPLGNIFHPAGHYFRSKLHRPVQNAFPKSAENGLFSSLSSAGARSFDRVARLRVRVSPGRSPYGSCFHYRVGTLLGLGGQQEMNGRPQKVRSGGFVHQRIHRL
jgi:hypothetical protein